MTRLEYMHKVLNKEYPKAEIIGEFVSGDAGEITFYPDPDNPNSYKAMQVLAMVYRKNPEIPELPYIDILDEF